MTEHAAPNIQRRTGLARLLFNRGIRQTFVADELGVTPGLVSRWCSGKVRIPDERVSQLSVLLDVFTGDIV